jgi:hypothetical protein
MARSSVARPIKKAPAVDADKVAKLVRLLASDKDGEVLAAIAALKRTLVIADMDLHDLADALVAGLKPRSTERTSWEPSPPDLHNWESMSWYCRFWSRHLRDGDREYIANVLLGRTGFDLRRATPELMRRLRDIVGRVEAARSAPAYAKARAAS